MQTELGTSKDLLKIRIAGLQASGSTFAYQVCKDLGLETVKKHGSRPENSTEFTLFHVRDIRDIVTTNAKRTQSKKRREIDIEKLLLKKINRFVEAGFARSVYTSRTMKDVVMIRYETYFPGKEIELIQLIADLFNISISRDEIFNLATRHSISANRERSQQFRSFAEWDEETQVHGFHITNDGLPGAWKGIFTERVKAHFKKKLGKLLVDLGYENDLDW